MTDAATPLTPDAIRALPAGREMDSRVAVAVGVHVPESLRFLDDADMMAYFGRVESDGTCHGPMRYSTDIGAAWAVVEWLAARGHRLNLDNETDDGWCALFVLRDGRDTGEVLGETAPLAICRAALLVSERLLCP